MEENKQVVAEWKATNQERLSEIKSFNPELYSAINLALNYLNKSLTGEELPQEVEEVEVQPTSQNGFWRIMTKQELIDKYGTVEKASFDIGWNKQGEMDWMLGMPVKDLIKDDLTEERIEYEMTANVLETDPSKDKNNKSWFVFRGFTIFDTSNVIQQTSQRKLSGWRILTEEEFKKYKYDDFDIPEHIWDEMYGKPIEDFYEYDSEIVEVIQKLNSNERPLGFTKGLAKGYRLPIRYFVYEYPTEQPTESKTSLSSQQTSQENWRFKTLDEIQKEGLGFFGLSEKLISKYTGKKLEDIVVNTEYKTRMLRKKE